MTDGEKDGTDDGDMDEELIIETDSDDANSDVPSPSMYEVVRAFNAGTVWSKKKNELCAGSCTRCSDWISEWAASLFTFKRYRFECGLHSWLEVFSFDGR